MSRTASCRVLVVVDNPGQAAPRAYAALSGAFQAGKPATETSCTCLACRSLALSTTRRAQSFAFPNPRRWVSDKWQAFSLRRDPATPWSHGDVRRRVRDFESVLNAYYPTVTDLRLTAGRRRLLRAASAWRYHTESYARPVELNLLQRAFRYQRPETTGFSGANNDFASTSP